MVSIANASRCHVGDWAYLKLRPFRQGTLLKHSSPKLASRFVGPFQVEARIGAVAYRLRLPDEARIHPLFHVS